MTYISLEQLKKFLNITGNEQDEVLENLIKTIEKIIDNYLGYSLLLAEYIEWYSAGDSSIIFVGAKPIAKVVSVKNEHGELFQVKRFYGNAIHLKHKAKGELEIHYFAGYEGDKIPLDIQQLMLNMCKQAYEDLNAEGTLDIKQKKIDTLSITYFSKVESIEGNDVRSQTSFSAVLENYKILQPMSI